MLYLNIKSKLLIIIYFIVDFNTTYYWYIMLY